MKPKTRLLANFPSLDDGFIDRLHDDAPEGLFLIAINNRKNAGKILKIFPCKIFEVYLQKIFEKENGFCIGKKTGKHGDDTEAV